MSTTTPAEESSDPGDRPCQYPGCDCPNFQGDANTSFQVCQRPGCGHRDIDHQIV